jgi:sugar (pentulose or hexulose) kinase
MSGNITWTGSEALTNVRPTPDGIHEQNPLEWWNGICRLARRLRFEVPQLDRVIGIAVTSTSGTLVAVDHCGDPIRPAILYDDQRAGDTAQKLNSVHAAGQSDWTASHSLTKAIWLRDAEPQAWKQVAYLLHPTDWLAGRLTGSFGIADHSSALKLGYEVERDGWHETVHRSGIPSKLLPEVVRSGELIGNVCPDACAESGLPNVPVVAGMTDGMAGLIASGASASGDANTTLGTTIVWKVLSTEKPSSSHSTIYSHLHPAGFWVPGAASNTGPGSLRPLGEVASGTEQDEAALKYLPPRIFCYPLSGKGERFPFPDTEMRAFATAEPSDGREWHATQLQAIAFVERRGYEVLEKCGVSIGPTVYSTGGAAVSKGLSRLRSSVLHRQISRCAEPSAAFGAAILAAANLHYGGNLSEAIRNMTHVAETHIPEPALEDRLDDAYEGFRNELRRRGYSE